MFREREQDELIELGVATAATKGCPVGIDDHQGGLFLPAGLSEE